MINIRTDLALEAKELYRGEQSKQELSGIETHTISQEEVLITRVKVTTEECAKKLGKPVGTYITLESPKIKNLDPDVSKTITYQLQEQLSTLISLKPGDTVLVVGLGNWNITPDALGPKTASQVMVTKHLLQYIPEQIDAELRPVSAVTPGVLGLTGVETSDIILGIVKKLKPALVIAVDALASKSPQRISTTIQLTDTGINPGSGVGNKREGLNQKTLGIPVIAIGVPTVVDAVSIASEMVTTLFDSILEQSKEGSPVYSVVKSLKDTGQDQLLRAVIDDSDRELMVTPKEVDNMISHISRVVANGINLALHPGIDLEYIENFMF